MGEYDKQQNKYVTFQSGNEYFALQIKYVKEIIVYQEITQIPESEEYVKGLINLRGKIIPVIDVRIRFKQEPVPYTDRTCIMVINVKGTVVGLIVDRVAEVVEIKPEDVLDTPTFGNEEKCQNRYVYALGKVGESVKMLLDPDRLLKDEDVLVPDVEDEDSKEEGEEE